MRNRVSHLPFISGESRQHGVGEMRREVEALRAEVGGLREEIALIQGQNAVLDDRVNYLAARLDYAVTRLRGLSGELRGEVFPDVPPALERWYRKNIDIRIFSSGSVLAQRLLFSSTKAGDLTKFLNGYFDTTTGPKNEPGSYRKIAKNFGIPASGILFISDVTRELDAARQAEMHTLLCVRPGNDPQPAHDHPAIMSFDQIE